MPYIVKWIPKDLDMPIDHSTHYEQPEQPGARTKENLDRGSRRLDERGSRQGPGAFPDSCLQI